MKPAVLVMLVVVAALVMLGAATSTWAVTSVPTPSVDGVQLPPQTTDHNGAAEAPSSVVAAALGFLTALPLGLTALADRVGGPRSGRVARALATLLAGVTAVTAGVAVVQGQRIEVVTLGGAQPTITGTAAPGVFALAALVVLLAGVAAWRIPRRRAAVTSRPSRYTVEAVRGEATPTDDDDHDEWDMAVDGETAAHEAEEQR